MTLSRRAGGLCLATAVMAGVTAGAAEEYTWTLPAGFPPPTVPADNPMSAARVELGRYLFYDTRLSGNGTQSCGRCHRQAKAFTDGRAQSVGSTGEIQPRSSMSLVNVAYAAVLTWVNPTVRRLEDQALVPIYGEHPIELGLTHADRWLEPLRRDPRIERLFASAFPGERDAITQEKDNPLKSASIRGFPITPEQRADLVAFLQSLTDTALLNDARFADPWPAAKGR